MVAYTYGAYQAIKWITVQTCHILLYFCHILLYFSRSFKRIYSRRSRLAIACYRCVAIGRTRSPRPKPGHMHLCWHVHPSNVKNLVVDEEKSVLNHQTHNACQTEDQCQSGARRGYAYRAPHITAVPRAQYTCSLCSGSKRNAHLNSGSSRPIRTSARLRPCRASSARICRDRDRV